MDHQIISPAASSKQFVFSARASPVQSPSMVSLRSDQKLPVVSPRDTSQAESKLTKPTMLHHQLSPGQ